MDVAAAKATEEPSDGRARRKDRNAPSQIVLIGERYFASTWWKKRGFIVDFVSDIKRRKERDLQYHHPWQKQTSFWNY